MGFTIRSEPRKCILAGRWRHSKLSKSLTEDGSLAWRNGNEGGTREVREVRIKSYCGEQSSDVAGVTHP